MVSQTDTRPAAPAAELRRLLQSDSDAAGSISDPVFIILNTVCNIIIKIFDTVFCVVLCLRKTPALAVC